MKSLGKELFIFDTNTLISGALIQNSSPSFSLIKAIESGFLCFSIETFLELNEVLEREKFNKYLSVEQRLDFLKRRNKVSKFFYPKSKFSICRDSKDNKFLDLAFISKANYIISGDKGLLILQNFHETQIISPSDFLKKN
jgi:uncharacterized protein